VAEQLDYSIVFKIKKISYNHSMKKTGVLLVNLGTPDSYKRKDVARYLGEFLMDGRVIDVPRHTKIYPCKVDYRALSLNKSS